MRIHKNQTTKRDEMKTPGSELKEDEGLHQQSESQASAAKKRQGMSSAEIFLWTWGWGSTEDPRLRNKKESQLLFSNCPSSNSLLDLDLRIQQMHHKRSRPWNADYLLFHGGTCAPSSTLSAWSLWPRSRSFFPPCKYACIVSYN